MGQNRNKTQTLYLPTKQLIEFPKLETFWRPCVVVECLRQHLKVLWLLDGKMKRIFIFGNTVKTVETLMLQLKTV